MNKKLIIFAMIGALMFSVVNLVYAEELPQTIAPGSQTYVVDFDRITRGLYYDGQDYYFVLEQGVPATDYLLNLHGEKYYFGSDGKMIKDEIVEYEEEKYYFDTNGTMVKDTWITHEEIDAFDGSKERTTYYFGPTGRAYRAVNTSNNLVIKMIDGARYGFNDEGARLEGYVTKDGNEVDVTEETECIDTLLYYFDPEENYAAAQGWILYNGNKPDDYDDEDELYLYFDPKTGRKVASNEVGKYIARVIEGERYLFDSNGIRQKKWYATPSNPGTPRYYSEDFEGFLSKGWFEAIPQDGCVREQNQKYHKDEEYQWYYAAKNGKIIRNGIKKIGKYYYCFDQDGVMQSDSLVVVSGVNSFVNAYRAYDLKRDQIVMAKKEYSEAILEDGQKWMYFTEPDNENLVGTMCDLNKTVVIEAADYDISFIANSRGGYGNQDVSAPVERNGRYFQNGVFLIPYNDTKYGLVRYTGKDEDPLYYLVNSTGYRINNRGAYKNESGEYILLGVSNDPMRYRGTYRFSKCKWAAGKRDGTDKSKAYWWYELNDGAELGDCPVDDLSSIQQYRVSDKDMYLNFFDYVESDD